MKKMLKTKNLIMLLLILLQVLVLSSCVEEQKMSLDMYKSLPSYEQKGGKETLRKKKYKNIILSEQAILDINNTKIYNAEQKPAIAIDGASSISIMNSEIVSKTTAICADGKDCIINAIASDISSYEDYVIKLTRKAVFTGSALNITGFGTKGDGIFAGAGTSVLLNNSVITVPETAIVCEALISISDTEINAANIKLYEGSTAVFSDSRIFTEHGINILNDNEQKTTHATMTLERTKINATSCAPLNVLGAKATIRLEKTDIEQNDCNALLLKESEVTVTLVQSSVKGSINIDDASTMNLVLKDNSTFTGSITGESKTTVISIEEGSTWEVCADSRVRTILLKDSDLSHIKSNGFTVYYDAGCVLNSWLNNAIYLLEGGGKLAPAN